MLSPQTATDERLTAALRDAGHRVTSQRIVLHRVLAELGRHTTAEELAGVASSRLPGLSLPTVYATLELFEDLGLVRRVSTVGSAALYDPRTDEHQHFLCRRCGAVTDVDAAIDAAALTGPARAAGLAVDGVDVVLRGVCADCRGAAGGID